MREVAYGTTVFCDDIRHEVNGKMTLVGCYLSEMNFIGPAPGVLPTFAALVNIRIPWSIGFKTLSLRITIEFEDGEIEEIFTAETSVLAEEREKALSELDERPKEKPFVSLTNPVQWSPLKFSKPGRIKVRAYLDGQHEVRLGVLEVRFPPPAEEAVETPKE